MSFKSEGRPVILIADDERLNRDLVRTFLESAGYVVIEATNGPDALALAQTEQPALAMLDVRMHGMSGYEVTRALKSDPTTAQMKVVILSAQNRATDQEAAREAGADDYLYKLLDWSEIMKRVNALVVASDTP
jgi:CheY-like chemotaxis protein